MIKGFPELVFAEEDPLELDPDAFSLDLLRAIYRNSSIPLHTRMRAASMAIGYEFPKLAATAFVSGQDFATLLDERVKRHRERLEQSRLVEGPKEHPASELRAPRIRRRI
jgi:hypothetical protein